MLEARLRTDVALCDSASQLRKVTNLRHVILNSHGFRTKRHTSRNLNRMLKTTLKQVTDRVRGYDSTKNDPDTVRAFLTSTITHCSLH
jgi:hypothetical protein